MTTDEYISKMKQVEKHLLAYIESELGTNFSNLSKLFSDLKICENKHYFTSLLHLIIKIANHHHRSYSFIEKIEKILRLFFDDIKKYFSNLEKFNIFKSNKRILLFLIEEKIIIVDECVVRKILNTEKFIQRNYHLYFLPEIETFQKEKWFNIQLDQKISDDFYKNRKIGQNDNKICKLIQNDSIDDFISYVSKKKISLNAKIESSIYETNQFLLKNEDTTLIEYAAFVGSVKIFHYLLKNDSEKSPSQLWLYAIHSQNTEIIQLIEDERIKVKNDDKQNECFIESVKCHHYDIANYIQNHFLKNIFENLSLFFKYYAFSLFSKDNLIHKTLFFCFCKYDYYLLADFLLKYKHVDVNKIIIISFIKLTTKYFNCIQNKIFQ